jgi:hypothetical protein
MAGNPTLMLASAARDEALSAALRAVLLSRAVVGRADHPGDAGGGGKTAEQERDEQAEQHVLARAKAAASPPMSRRMAHSPSPRF